MFQHTQSSFFWQEIHIHLSKRRRLEITTLKEHSHVDAFEQDLALIFFLFLIELFICSQMCWARLQSTQEYLKHTVVLDEKLPPPVEPLVSCHSASPLLNASRLFADQKIYQWDFSPNEVAHQVFESKWKQNNKKSHPRHGSYWSAWFLNALHIGFIEMSRLFLIIKYIITYILFAVIKLLLNISARSVFSVVFLFYGSSQSDSHYTRDKHTSSSECRTCV